jgi:hypothetical protein
MADDGMMRAEMYPDASGLFRSHAALRAQADAHNVPSGILVDVDAGADLLDALDGNALAPVAGPDEWIGTWRLLAACALQPMDALRDPAEDAAALWGVGVTPLYIADFAYERLRPRALVHVRRSAGGDSSALPPLAHLVERGHALFATALLPLDYDLFTPRPGKHYGLQATFVLPADGYRTNTGRALRSAALDLGDGRVVELRPGEPVRHDFARYGHHTLSLTLRTEDGAERVSAFTFEVAEPAPAASIDPWELTDGNARATAWIFLGRENGVPHEKLERPVIIAEGFPGGRTIQQLFPLVNQQQFVITLQDKGYDVIILGFADGTLAIQENARLYVKCVKRAIADKNNTHTIAAGGASMGGLIARYALCSMEHAGEDHQTRLFFTVDTPHNGANIAMSVQAFVQLYSTSSHGEGAKVPARQMASLAAQQMLLFWIPPYSEWQDGKEFPPASPERGKFVDDLRRIGWMPQMRRIGVADGVATGTGNGVKGGEHAFWMECTFLYWANLHALDETASQFIDTTCGGENWKFRGGFGRIDGAPGGTRASWKEAYDGAGSGVRRDVHDHTHAHCFVSSASACAIAGAMYEPLGNRPSELHAYRTSTTTNLPHVELTEAMKDFLVAEISAATASGDDAAVQGEAALAAP